MAHLMNSQVHRWSGTRGQKSKDLKEECKIEHLIATLVSFFIFSYANDTLVSLTLNCYTACVCHCSPIICSHAGSLMSILTEAADVLPSSQSFRLLEQLCSVNTRSTVATLRKLKTCDANHLIVYLDLF